MPANTEAAAAVAALSSPCSPPSYAQVGQLIKVKIKDVVSGRPVLSLFTAESALNAALGQAAGLVGAAGDHVSGKVVGKDAASVSVLLADEQGKAVLPAVQLCDNPARSERRLAQLKRGARVVEAVVLDAGKRLISAKPGLVAAARSPEEARPAAPGLPPTPLLASKAEHLQLGVTLVGHVTNVVAAVGVFIEFAGGLRALAPRANLADQFVADANEVFQRGQTVLAVVTDVREPEDEGQQRRVVVSLKPSALGEVAPGYHAVWLREALGLLPHAGGEGPAAAASVATRFPIGANAQGTVTAVSDLGLEIALSQAQGEGANEANEAGAETVRAFCIKAHLKDGGKPLREGDKVVARVLDNTDAIESRTSSSSSGGGVVDVSLRLSHVKAGVVAGEALRKAQAAAVQACAALGAQGAGAKSSKKAGKVAAAAATPPQPARAVVELVKANYVVLSLPEHGSLLCFAPTQGYNGPVFGLGDLEIDVRCEARAVELAGAERPGLLLGAMLPTSASLRSAEQQAAARKRARSRGESLDFSGAHAGAAGDKLELSLGVKVLGTVRDVHQSWVHVQLPPGLAVAREALHGTDAAGAPTPERLHGQMHLSDCVRDLAALNALADTNRSVIERLNVGDAVECEVTGFQQRTDSKGKKVLNVQLAPVAEHEAAARETHAKKSKKTAKTLATAGDRRSKALEPGEQLLGFVDTVSDDAVHISLGPKAQGSVYCAQVSTDIQLLDRVFNGKDHSAFKQGSVVKVTVLGHAASGCAVLSMIH
jgi:ribosomal protein S1